MVAHSSDYEPNAFHWIETFYINHFLCLEHARKESNCHIIQRCVETWSRTVQLRAQYRAESDLLMSVTRLSRSEERPTAVSVSTETAQQRLNTTGLNRSKITRVFQSPATT